MNAIIALLIILVTTYIDYVAGKYFAAASSNLGDYLRLPKSVKGATFDAIASSFPELMVAVFAVIAFKKFEVGIGTIAGSALFNLLVIPAICVLIAPKAFKVAKEIVHRDAYFYLMAVFALLAALFFSKMWGLVVPISFLVLYYLYIRVLKKDSDHHRKNTEVIAHNIKPRKELFKALITMTIIAVATYYLTEASIGFAEAVGISPVIIAFTVIAAATSVPDGIISIVNARKGSLDDAASNVFGSNIFDILIGLSIPLILAYIFTGPSPIVFNNMDIIFGLLGATIFVIYRMTQNFDLTKTEAKILLGIYGVFILYIILM